MPGRRLLEVNKEVCVLDGAFSLQTLASSRLLTWRGRQRTHINLPGRAMRVQPMSSRSHVRPIPGFGQMDRWTGPDSGSCSPAEQLGVLRQQLVVLPYRRVM